jgi:hypothetical protein
MTKLVGIDHGPDRLDHAVGDVELDHADHAPLGVVQHGARLAVDPGQPEGDAEDPGPAEQADEQPHDALPPAQRLPDRPRLAATVPVEHHVGREHAEQRVHVAARGGLEEPAGEFLAFRPARRGGALPRTCPPAAMRCLARAKICRQFTSVLPTILATSG